jgi:hypothetical protein
MLVFTMAHLRALARDYAAATGVEFPSMGTAAAGNWKLFIRLADGAGCSAKGAEAATNWFLKNWPAHTPWPSDVPDLRRPCRRRRVAGAEQLPSQ